MIPKKDLWKALRAKCVDCSGHQHKEIRLCTVLDCELWPYRMGKGKDELVEITPFCQKSDLMAG